MQILSVPFVLTSDHVGSIAPRDTNWLGELDDRLIPQWVDLLIAMVTDFSFSFSSLATFFSRIQLPFNTKFIKIYFPRTG